MGFCFDGFAVGVGCYVGCGLWVYDMSFKLIVIMNLFTLCVLLLLLVYNAFSFCDFLCWCCL